MADFKEALERIKRALAEKKLAPGATAQREPTQAASEGGGATPRASVPRDICIGLDFGTSSTKAVARLLPSGPAFAIPLGGSSSGDQPYLAPTRLAVTTDGALSLSPLNGGGWVEDLKVKLMGTPWEAAPIIDGRELSARPADLAAAYIGLVLQKALAWCEQSIRPILGGAEIRWSMNLGIPARDFDAVVIKEGFLTVALAAWHLTDPKGVIDLSRASRAVDLAKTASFQPRGISRDLVDVVPEVAAGVTTYARSPQRRTGPHLFVDVGATTLDTSMFLLAQSADGPRYVFLSADVDSDLGAIRLHRYRAYQLGRLALARFVASDPLKPIPATAQECMPPAADIQALDAQFSDRCVVKLGKVVWAAKMKDTAISVPDDRPAEPIQVLLSGGGVRLPFYQEAIWESGRRVAPGGGLGLRVRPFQEVPIPRPADLRAPGLSDDDWKRLAIAYGLSFALEDIGEFVPPSAVPDLPPPRRRDDADRFVGKDQV